MEIQNVTIVSYNSHTLNDTTYEAKFPDGTPPQAEGSIKSIPRAGNWPQYAGVSLGGRTLPIRIRKKDGSDIGSILSWFPVHDQERRVLIVKEADNTQWYVNAKVQSTPRLTLNMLDVIFFVDDPIWKTVSTQTSTWDITGTAQTKNVVVGGNDYALPTFTIGPTAARTGGYAYIRYAALANRTTLAYNDAINLIDGDWDTEALIDASKMQADGDDVRVIDDRYGSEIYRWFGGGGIDSATTRLIVNVNLPPLISATINGAIADTGAVATITLKNTVANRKALKSLDTEPYKVLAIDLGGGTQEIFTYTGINNTALQITGVTRAQKGSSMAAHADGATLRHVSAGYWVLYGSSDAEAPTVDDDFKPMYDLATFTNTSRPLTSFYDPANPARYGQFIPRIIRNVGSVSEYYTADGYTFADVATEMGAIIKAYQVGTAWRPGNAGIAWEFYHPAGMTNVTLDGEKYRYSTTWPKSAALKKSTTGKIYSVVANEATPTAAQAWEALTTVTGSKSLSGTYKYIQLLLDGAVGAVEDNYAAVEFDNITLALDSNYTPLIWFIAEANNNHETFRLTNNTTSEWLEVDYPVPVDDTIVIDTENLEVYRTSDNSPIPISLDDETRAEWLRLTPGATNVLQYDEIGANEITIVTTWKNRSV